MSSSRVARRFQEMRVKFVRQDWRMHLGLQGYLEDDEGKGASGQPPTVCAPLHKYMLIAFRLCYPPPHADG